MEPTSRQTAGRFALLLRNPASGRAGEDLSAARERFIAGGLPLIDAPAQEDEALRAAQAAALIVVAGGDGTLHRAAPLLMRAQRPFAILPLGTANDLARSLGVPDAPLAAAELVFAGHLRTIDLGEVNGAPFFNVASVGVSVELARELTGETKRRFGSFSYVVAGARALMRAHRFSVIIESETGVRRARTFQVAVGNGRYYGGGMSVHHACQIGDGRLYLYSLEMRSLWRLLLMAFDFRAGVHGAWEDVRTQEGVWFVLRTRRPRAINADGEIVGRTPAHMRLLPGVLQVYAPAPPE